MNRTNCLLKNVNKSYIIFEINTFLFNFLQIKNHLNLKCISYNILEILRKYDKRAFHQD